MHKGSTIIEMLVATALLLLFAVVAFTPQEITQRRQQEEDLRIALKDMRSAIDRYHAEKGQLPTSINTLITTKSSDGGCFLRSFPLNPFTASTQWSIRATDVNELAAALPEGGWTFITRPGATLPFDAGISNIRVPASKATSVSGMIYEFDADFKGLNGVPYFKW
ncbi:MAG: type II secretion system protein [Candidatus Riflebacteria bacterium]|nr:type II secretion system protein [Candidatus Riflebacteria bacterium]